MNIVYNQLVSQVCMFASNYKMQILFLIIYKIIVDIIYLVCIGRRSEFGIIISFPDIYDMLPYVPAPPDEVRGFPVCSVPHTTDSGYGSGSPR